MDTTTHTSHVVIIGAGFGGLRAARALAKAPVKVTLIDRNNYHLFQPLLYQVATAGVAPDEIAYPVRAIFQRQANFTFRMAEVRAIDVDNRRVLTSTGEVPYDALIVAAGGQTHYYGNTALAASSFGLKSLQDADAIRSHLLRQFELAAQENDPYARQAHLTFVIAGGGPSGVEMAGAISELVSMLMARDHAGLRATKARVLLLEGGTRLLPAFPDDLGAAALADLRQKGVEVRLGALVDGFDGAQVGLRGGETLAAHTLVWAAGIKASGLAAMLGAELDGLGRVRVDEALSVPGHAEIYVVGDMAHVEDAAGQPLPMVAPVAMQQAEHAAANIRRVLAGQAALPFRYRDPGSMATIGRRRAVVRLGRLHLTGPLAWLMWLFVHLMQLVGFRNRLVVLINWAMDYVFYDRAVRLILPDPRPAERPIM